MGKRERSSSAAVDTEVAPANKQTKAVKVTPNTTASTTVCDTAGDVDAPAAPKKMTGKKEANSIKKMKEAMLALLRSSDSNRCTMGDLEKDKILSGDLSLLTKTINELYKEKKINFMHKDVGGGDPELV